MEQLLKGSIYTATVVLTGLSAGLFYAWAVSVIPGTKLTSNISYLETMQHINRAIINPWFMVIFMGPLLGMIISGIMNYGSGIDATFWYVVVAFLTYLVGTFGVTALGNVPLNDGLDAIHIGKLTGDEMNNIRLAYEQKWNKLHNIRTLFSVVSFVLLLVPLFKAKF